MKFSTSTYLLGSMLAFASLTLAQEMPFIQAEDAEEEYITWKDKRNIFNAVKGSLDPWASTCHPSGMFAVPATLPKNTVLSQLPTTVRANSSSVFKVENGHLSLSRCRQLHPAGSANLTTIKTNRVWKFAYFDGSSDPWHSPPSGSLRDYLYNTKVNRTIADLSMHEGICQWIDKRYDGFIYMDETMTIVKCQVDDDSFEVLSTVAITAAEQVAECRTIMNGALNFAPSTRAAYNAMTGIELHWGYGITAYAKLLPGVADTDIPSLNASLLSPQDLYYFEDELTMVTEVMPMTELKPTKVNWQAHVDKLVQVYAGPLLVLSRSTNFEEFQSLIRSLSATYTGYTTKNETSLDLCIDRYLPDASISKTGTPTEAMLFDVLDGVASKICTTLLDLQANKTSASQFTQAQSEIKTLMTELAWSDFIFCEPACSTGFKCLLDKELVPKCVSIENALLRVQQAMTSTPEAIAPAPAPAPTLTRSADPLATVEAIQEPQRVQSPQPKTSAAPANDSPADDVKQAQEPVVSAIPKTDSKDDL